MYFLQNNVFKALFYLILMMTYAFTSSEKLSGILNSAMEPSQKIDNLTQYLSETVTHSSEWKLVLYNRSVLNYRLKNLKAASEDLILVLSRFPEDSDSLHNLIIILTELGQYSKAEQYIGNYISHNPDHHSGYFLSGNLYMFKGEFRSAIEQFNKALFFNPYHLDSLNNRGWAYFHSRQYERSFQDFESVLKINSEHESALEGKREILKLIEAKRDSKN